VSGYALSPAFGTLSDDSDRRFRRLLATFAVPALIAGSLIPLVDLPSLIKQVITPQRYAKLVQQAPVEEKKIEDKKPEPAVERPKLTQEQQVEKARLRARKALSALDSLAQLRDVSMPTISAPLQGQVIGSPSNTNAFAASAANTSGGIGEIGIVDRGASTTGLGHRSTTAVRSNIAGGKTGGSPKLRRTEEEIQLVFDRNKGALYTIYLRELRVNPDAHGKLVVRLTIAPSGAVKGCTVVSSEFASAEFANKIVARVKLMDFGPKDVGDFTMDYPVTFFPQN
jgi:periplasmic protein TonB